MAATGLLPAMAQPTGPIGVQNWLTSGLLGAQNAKFGRDPDCQADRRTAVQIRRLHVLLWSPG